MSASEDLRDDLRRVIRNYGSVTVCEILGVLELLKAETIDALKACDHPDAQKRDDTAAPDL